MKQLAYLVFILYCACTNNTPKDAARLYGEAIISGQVRASDNDSTLAWLDSLTSPNKNTRDFAFDVYLAMTTHADGALSEVIGVSVKEYLSSYPKEFIHRCKSLEPEKWELVKDDLSKEFYFLGEDFETELDQYFILLIKECKDCDVKDREWLSKLQDTLHNEITQMQ